MSLSTLTYTAQQTSSAQRGTHSVLVDALLPTDRAERIKNTQTSLHCYNKMLLNELQTTCSA